MKKPLVLCILDGLAFIKETKGNAVAQAKKPNLDALLKTYPHTTLTAAGKEVGLPDGQMGNSEVGHLNIGAGRIVYQSLTLINKEIEEGTFFENTHLLKAIEHAKINQSSLQILGLLSNGGVHSEIKHIEAILQLAKDHGLTKVFVHAFLDGRDVPPNSGVTFIVELENKMKALGIGQIASISGRYYAMDRDKRMDRLTLAYDVIVKQVGASFVDAKAYVEASYAQNVYDEFVMPAYNRSVKGNIEDHDAIIFANFRPDRAIQLASALTNPEYLFETDVRREDNYFVSLMRYADSVKGDIAFALPKLTNTLGDFLSEHGYTQVRIAETEKYAHVTFFFDGGIDKELAGATRILVNSPKVATYDLQPEMSAFEVTDKLIEKLNQQDTDVVILNFANCDMVGHTGIMSAAIKAVETVDTCVGRLLETVNALGGTLLVTADHGNSEQLEERDGSPFTAHTTNPVPFIVCKKGVVLSPGKLGDIAPTMLDLLGVEKPSEMTGISLIKK